MSPPFFGNNYKLTWLKNQINNKRENGVGSLPGAFKEIGVNYYGLGARLCPYVLCRIIFGCQTLKDQGVRHFMLNICTLLVSDTLIETP